MADDPKKNFNPTSENPGREGTGKKEGLDPQQQESTRRNPSRQESDEEENDQQGQRRAS
jgi:hypothetical protein